jgi:multiple sugar transport system permease protein
MGEELTPQGREMRFRVVLQHVGHDRFPILPLAVVGPRGTQFLHATFPPATIKGLGTTGYWDNLTAGAIGYVFHYFIQAWTEFRSREGGYLFPRWVWNSFLIAVLQIVVAVVFATMAGYALARLRFPGRNFLFFLVTFTMMVPPQVTFISNYILLRDGIFGISRLFGRENLINTYWAIFLPVLVSSLGVVLMKQFLESIPREIEEAARIDGASTFRIYSRIILPLCRPAIAVLTILTFQGSWNAFFWPLVVLRDTEMFTLPIGLLFFRQYYGAAGGANWNLILAGTVISAIPVLIIFLLFQRYFVQGFHLSGIKQ